MANAIARIELVVPYRGHRLAAISLDVYEDSWPSTVAGLLAEGLSAERRRPQLAENQRAFRRFASEQGQGSCQWCRMPFGPGEIVQADHVVPLAVGGTNNWRNLVVSCDRCNAARKKTHPDRVPCGLRWSTSIAAMRVFRARHQRPRHRKEIMR